MGQQWPAVGTRVLAAADLGMAKALLEETAINPTIEPPELRQDWGNRLLEGTDKILCTPGPIVPTETEPELCLCLLQRHRAAVACYRGRVLGAADLGMHKPSRRRSTLTPP